MGQETTGIEWKSATTWNKKERPSLRIVRGMLALANRRGGGYLVVGITTKTGEDAVKRPEPDYLTEAQAESLNYDALADFVRATSDPPVVFERKRIEVEPGKFAVVIGVDEFADEPVLCVRDRHTSDNQQVLAEGTLYYRNHGSVSSKPIASAADMRDLLRLATEKRLQRYQGIRDVVEAAKGEPDAFEAEAEDF